MYSSEPDGLIGNEDCGQMSAWYIMSALGLYEACPGSGEYCLTTPVFKDATLRLANGRTLRIIADDPSGTYIVSVRLNGVEVDRNYLTYREIMNGGELSFELSDKPCRDRGVSPDSAPYSLTDEPLVPEPYTTANYRLFTDELSLDLDDRTAGAEIRYTVDGTCPTQESPLYVKPLHLTESTVVKAVAFGEDGVRSPVLTVDAVKAEYMPALDDVTLRRQLQPGVDYRYFEGKATRCRDVAGLRLVESGSMPKADIGKARCEDHFAYIFEGFVDIPETSVWRFWTYSDDGSVLFIDGHLVVDNDGGHSAMRSTGDVALDKGLHSYRVVYFEDYEGQAFDWGWRDPQTREYVEIPSERTLRKK